MDTSSFAQKIKAARQAKGMSKQELATTLGVTVNSLSDFERGRITPSYPVFCRLIEILEVSPDILLAESLDNSDGVLLELCKKAEKLQQNELHVLLDLLNSIKQHMQS